MNYRQVRSVQTILKLPVRKRANSYVFDLVFYMVLLPVVIGEAAKLNIRDYECEWEDEEEEEENEFVFEKAESERWELKLSKARFRLTEHGILI